jgi:hypothetical protein
MARVVGQTEEGDEVLFSRAYLKEPSALRDSLRFRRRLFGWFSQNLTGSEYLRFAYDVIEELGASIAQYKVAGPYETFFIEGELRDVLDSITLMGKVCGDGRTGDLRVFVSRAFREESMGYVLNKAGRVRFSVDAEYERSRFSVIDGLGSGRFKAVRASVEDAFEKLDREPFETKAAVRSMFEAVETLCKVLGDHNEDLNERMIQKRIRPIAIDVYGATDSSAQSFAEQTVEAFIKWVNAGHRYRHGQKTEEPHDPPLELAVAFLSQGAAYIRFLIDLGGKKG